MLKIRTSSSYLKYIHVLIIVYLYLEYVPVDVV